MNPQDSIDIAALHRALTGTRFAQRLRHFDTIDSTNTRLLAAAETSPEGTAYIADEQTAGRGRSAHAWHSAPGDGLYLSALVKPSLLLRDALHLSLATGLAVQAAVHQTSGIALDIRWPNDLTIADRKLGGILVESTINPGKQATLRYAVIGIGINIHHTHFPAELAPIASSLALSNPTTQPSRQLLITAILRNLDLELSRLEAHDPTLLDRFTQASAWVCGKRVHVPEQGGYTGTTSGLDSRGFLLVTTDTGEQRTVLSGGVRSVAH